MKKEDREVIAMNVIRVEEMLEKLRMVEDPRRQWGNLRHLLSEILFICICAIISKMEDIDGIVLFAQERKEWLRDYLELKNGVPSYSTFERVLRLIDPTTLEKFYQEWIGGLRGTKAGQISIDGKTIRGAGAIQKIHMVSAWAREDGLCLGEVRTDEKSNEITAIPELLEMIDVGGTVVSIDAMGCQKEIAAKIIERRADYILALKENQPTLYKGTLEYVDWVEKDRPSDIIYDRWVSRVEKEHGRIERRTVTVCECKDWPGVTDEWASIHSLIRYDCTRECKGEKTKSTRYYISSLQDTTAETMAHFLRGHWSIENQLHWVLDVTFKEDASMVRMNHAPENLSILRKVALSLLKTTPSAKKTSLKGLMVRAALNPDFLESVLFAQDSK